MNRWIEGPGAVFKRQREDSTNYLGAYDKAGRLIRASESRAKERELQRQLADPTTETERAVDAESELEEIRMKEEDEKHKEAGRGGSRDRKGAKGGGKDGGEEKEVPPETIEDLLPFPLNPFFRSQSVLSEALRDEVYRRVVEAGQTVREVSQALSITMERVGAVVRLKTIENDWSRDVCFFSSFPLCACMLFQATKHQRPRCNDETTKFRLVLKTPTWLHSSIKHLIRVNYPLYALRRTVQPQVHIPLY